VKKGKGGDFALPLRKSGFREEGVRVHERRMGGMNRGTSFEGVRPSKGKARGKLNSLKKKKKGG